MKKLENVKFQDLMVWNTQVILCVLFVFTSIFIANGQDRIYAIDVFAKTKSVNQRSIAMKTTSETLFDATVAEFRNLYYNIQPARYYTVGRVNDVAKRSALSVIYVDSQTLNRLNGDSNVPSNDKFNTVQMLVIEGAVNGTLPVCFNDVDKFQDLKFVVFKNAPKDPSLDRASTANLFSKSFWDAHPDVVVIYNNLSQGN